MAVLGRRGNSCGSPLVLPSMPQRPAPPIADQTQPAADPPAHQLQLPEPPDPLDKPACSGSPAKSSHHRRLARIGQSPRWKGQQFGNTADIELKMNPLDFRMAADFAFGGKKRAPQGRIPLEHDIEVRLSGPPSQGLRLTWLGHSTVLVEIDGVRLLTDPVWGARASPVSFAGPRRFHPAPLALADLGRIDAILLSHDHYDHLCAPTWRKLLHGAAPGWSGKVVTALGVGAHLERLGVAPENITELDWGEGTWIDSAGARVQVVGTPSQHFSGRGALDRNRTLWSGLAVLGPHHRVFFSGDTGPTPEHADIGASLGPFDVVLFEIGAWHPAWGSIHLGPERAFEAFASMGARALLPVHWGTFDLALHHWAEPAETLWNIAVAKQAQVWQPRIGGSVEPGATVAEPWWRAVK